MSEARAAERKYKVDIRKDIEEVTADADETVKELLRTHVFPHFGA